jgi:hypothetical protein
LKVKDLIEKLEEYDEDMEVEIHYQYSYPLKGYLSRFTEVDKVLYIAMEQDRDTPYGSRKAWEGEWYND